MLLHLFSLFRLANAVSGYNYVLLETSVNALRVCCDLPARTLEELVFPCPPAASECLRASWLRERAQQTELQES
jgi:hypothetical protein